MLDITESNAERRRAALRLALREDAGYQTFAGSVREARANLFSAERRIAVVRQRIYLVRAALAFFVRGAFED